MRQEVLQDQLTEILENSFHERELDERVNEVLSLSESDMFKLWNLLGEELGIDLSLASTEQRRILFESCKNGKRLAPKEFGSLLWLMYYAEPHYQ